MSKILKAILLSFYASLLIQYVKTLFKVSHEEITDLQYVLKTPGTLKKMDREIKNMSRSNISITNWPYKKPKRLPTDLKLILKWTDAFGHYTSTILKNGQDIFVARKCEYCNCFLTNDKRLLVDTRHFDAILFDVENTWDVHPFLRSTHQKYIFVASESSDNFPICHPHYDNYYNRTWSYRLDSDIRWSYITVYDKNGTVVGPNVNMKWKYPMDPIPEKVKAKLVHKKKPAAWFVSHCNAKSKRDNVTRRLVWELGKYGYDIDVYGFCGKLKCPKEQIELCLELLEKTYYFYLAFENSISEDYVTEKLLYAMQHYTVPIVFGGANYSRFLPPGSYIDAGKNDAITVAAMISKAIENSKVYHDYFRWHNYYEYMQTPQKTDVCELCKLMNVDTKTHSIKHFRRWWNTDVKKRCRHYLKGGDDTRDTYYTEDT